MSNADHSTVEIYLLGKSYTFRCGKDEAPSLERSAQYLDSALTGVRQHAKTISNEKVALMAALNITHELQHEIEMRRHLEQEVERLNAKIDRVLARISPKDTE